MLGYGKVCAAAWTSLRFENGRKVLVSWFWMQVCGGPFWQKFVIFEHTNSFLLFDFIFLIWQGTLCLYETHVKPNLRLFSSEVSSWSSWVWMSNILIFFQLHVHSMICPLLVLFCLFCVFFFFSSGVRSLLKNHGSMWQCIRSVRIKGQINPQITVLCCTGEEGLK